MREPFKPGQPYDPEQRWEPEPLPLYLPLERPRRNGDSTERQRDDAERPRVVVIDLV